MAYDSVTKKKKVQSDLFYQLRVYLLKSGNCSLVLSGQESSTLWVTKQTFMGTLSRGTRDNSTFHFLQDKRWSRLLLHRQAKVAQGSTQTFLLILVSLWGWVQLQEAPSDKSTQAMGSRKAPWLSLSVQMTQLSILQDTLSPHTSKVWWKPTEQHHTLPFTDKHCAASLAFKVFNIWREREKKNRQCYFLG